MRPHSLRLQAFGAFPGETTLDLQTLGEQGLVLLTGDTGSGKTTLLDAIGFALYGTVVGERSKARDLRSHHAADGVEPWVELEFTSRGRRMRVRRSPAWSRPGRATDVPAKAALHEWVSGAWVARSTRLDEIGHELSSLLGMTAEQFHSVVVLPQGRFATFLQASSNEREALLKKLFLVERFEFVQEWLADRARTASDHLAAATATVDGLAGRVAQVDGTDVPDDASVAVWATDLLAAGASAQHAADERLERVTVVRSSAAAALSETRELHRRQQLRMGLEAQLESLHSRSAQSASDRAAVSDAERARPVLLAQREEQRQLSELRNRALACQALEEALDLVGLGHVVPLGEVEGADAVLLETLQAAQQRSGRFATLRDAAARALTAHQEAAAARERIKTAELAQGVIQQRLTELPTESSEITERVRRGRAALQALPQRRLDLAARVEALDGRLALGEEEAELRDCRVQLRDAEAAIAMAETLEQELRNRRIDAAATELAAYLEDGTPCPVCGSLDHPELAEVRDDDVSVEQERAARAVLGAARSELARLLGAVAAGEERVGALAALLAGTEDGEDLTVLTAEVAAMEATAAALGAAERQQRDAGQEESRLQVSLATEQGVAAASAETLESALRTAGAHEEQLSAELGDLSLEEAIERNQHLVDVASRAAAALLALQTARRGHRQADATLRELCREQGFATPEEAAAAALSDTETAAIRRAVVDHDTALAATTARLADAELAVDVDPPAEVDVAAALLEAAEKEQQSAAADATLLQHRVAQLSLLVPRLAAAISALAPLQADVTLLRELADVAAGRGANRLRMPLASFVLAARLEEVAEAASLRLERMTAGRYALVHSDGGRDGRSRAGLALQVEDGWTGRRRDTATLSGGETFQAALALALGLADVVTAETGGATIDALFVDEGFGSLDPDSLDAVMDVLDELRSGGRLVGVVSHVAEMRQRIPAQIQVAKGTTGSSLTTTSGLAV